METKHTPGMLEVEFGNREVPGFPIRIGGGIAYMPIADDGKHTANARRIVACWNACEGVPDEALEGGWTAKGLSDYAKSLEQQRDELLAAMIALRNVEFGHSEDDICKIRISIDAAIAKATRETK